MLVGVALVTLVVGWLAWSMAPSAKGANLHVVVPEVLLRSGQLTVAELEEVARQHGVRTIINLRGPQGDAPWYEAQVAAARRLGIHHVDLHLTADRQPPREDVVRLIRLLESSARPILIHCDAGADRAGFASVVGRLVVAGAPLEAARSELSMRYGHLPFGPTAELDRFFDRYEGHLERAGEPHDTTVFKRWVRGSYAPYGYDASIEALRFPDRATAGVAFEMEFRIVNRSSETWEPWAEERGGGVRLGFRVRRGDGTAVHYPHRLDLPSPVVPGGVAEISGLFFTPGTPGDYTVTVDLVDEAVTWFARQGSRPLALVLKIEPGGS